MKYAFSTIGCPRWDFNDIVATAKDLGYDGIEIRGIADEIYAPKIKNFSPSQIASTMEQLKGLEISMLTSQCCVAVFGDEENIMREGCEYIQLANKLGAKYVRILCTNSAGLDGGDYKSAVRNYKNLCAFARDYDVTPLIETNGMFCDTKLLKKFIEEVNMDNSGILWDIHHPYRFNNEPIADTAENILQYVKYVHIKDSVVANGGTVYKMLGHGDIPIKDALDALEKSGYEGYITMEWVKRWMPDLEEPGIVFAHFINKIKSY